MIDFSKLREPFPESAIEWRIGRSGIKNGKPWATCLAYVTNRAIMNRLDDVAGPENWKNEFREWHGGSQLCGISIKVGDEWITKWDGADNSNMEAVKGGLSDSQKRSAVQWGIGRYLYELEEGFAVISDSGLYSAKIVDKQTGAEMWVKWSPPKLGQEFLPASKMPVKPTSPDARQNSHKILPSTEAVESIVGGPREADLRLVADKTTDLMAEGDIVNAASLVNANCKTNEEKIFVGSLLSSEDRNAIKKYNEANKPQSVNAAQKAQALRDAVAK